MSSTSESPAAPSTSAVSTPRTVLLEPSESDFTKGSARTVQLSAGNPPEADSVDALKVMEMPKETPKTEEVRRAA